MFNKTQTVKEKLEFLSEEQQLNVITSDQGGMGGAGTEQSGTSQQGIMGQPETEDGVMEQGGTEHCRMEHTLTT